jgi:hypothetical protein
MQQREQHAAGPSRWILYHGTSSYRLRQIRRENRLRVSPEGPPKVGLTTERAVSDYFAWTAMFDDDRDHRGEGGEPVVLALDGGKLLALGYNLTNYVDQQEGPGVRDWENELGCWSDIYPLDEVLIEVLPAPDEQFGAYLEIQSRELVSDTFVPKGPRLAQYELSVMKDVVERLVEREITVDKANAITSAINDLRLMVRTDSAVMPPPEQTLVARAAGTGCASAFRSIEGLARRPKSTVWEALCRCLRAP